MRRARVRLGVKTTGRALEWSAERARPPTLNVLQAEVAKLEASAAGHRADYERERDRGDRLVTELEKLTALLAKPDPEPTSWLIRWHRRMLRT